MSVELTTLISIVSVIVAAFAAIVGYQSYQYKKTSTSRTHTKKDVEEKSRTNAKLEYIGRGVDDIKIDMKANEKHLHAIAERVSRNEESTKQAHKRIDNLEGPK